MKSIILFFSLLLQLSTAQTAIYNNDYDSKLQHDQRPDRINPFLSATLSTKITTAPFAIDTFDSTHRSVFTEMLRYFLTKTFDDQQIHNVRIVDVTIFDDHVVHIVGGDDRRHDARHDAADADSNAVSFSTVISAERAEEGGGDRAGDGGIVTNEHFRQMIVHICDRFQRHLVQFMRDSGDEYLMEVDSVTLGDYERMANRSVNNNEGATSNDNSTAILGMSEDTLNLASIIAIAVGGVVFVVMSFASISYYR